MLYTSRFLSFAKYALLIFSSELSKCPILSNRSVATSAGDLLNSLHVANLCMGKARKFVAPRIRLPCLVKMSAKKESL